MATKRTVGRTGANITQAKTKGDHSKGVMKGTVRAPSGRTGTGFSGSKLRKGTIRSTNTYKGGK